MIVSRVSTASVIEKMFRDYRIKDEEFVYDAIEWASEAMQLIGGPSLLVETGAYLHIQAYKAVLPPRVLAIEHVLYSPLVEGGQYTPTDEVFPLMPDSSTYHRGLHHPSASNQRSDWDHRYKINGGYIHTSFEQGTLYMIYKTVEVGADGFPVMPDHPSWSSAIVWYIAHKMMLTGQIPNAVFNFQYAEQQWNKYCRIARHASVSLDRGQSESIRRGWNELMQDPTKWSTFFADRSPNVSSYADPKANLNITTDEDFQ